ncbi:MAG: hypothetical protein IKC04_03020, partial [Oscillospiraceae bacterium]|nr:hypothetical protein [Oscillospiraceae bacterium]
GLGNGLLFWELRKTLKTHFLLSRQKKTVLTLQKKRRIGGSLRVRRKPYGAQNLNCLCVMLRCRFCRPRGNVFGFPTAPLAFPIFGCSRRLFGCCAVWCGLHQRQRCVGLSQCRSRTPEIGECAKGLLAVFLLGIQNPFLFARKKKSGFGKQSLFAGRIL